MPAQIQIPEHTPERLGILSGVLTGLFAIWRIFFKHWWDARRSRLVMQEKTEEKTLASKDQVVESYKTLYNDIKSQMKELEDRIEEQTAQIEFLKAQLMETHKRYNELFSISKMALFYLEQYDKTLSDRLKKELGLSKANDNNTHEY